MAAFKSIDVSDYIKNFDLSAVDITAFGSASDSDFIALTKGGDTLEFSGSYEDFLKALPRRFDGYTNPGRDSKLIKRGANVSMHEVAGVSGRGVVTGRYRLRDGRVHFWGYVNED